MPRKGSSVTDPNAPDTQYFATLPPEQIGAALIARRQRFERYLKESGLYELFRRAHRNYHSQGEDGFTSFKVGLKGEKRKFVALRMDHFRSIVRRWVGLARSQRVAFTPISKFRGYDANRQVKMARSAIDHWMEHAHLEEELDSSVEFASYLGAAHLETLWDDSAGEVSVPPLDSGPPIPVLATPGDGPMGSAIDSQQDLAPPAVSGGSSGGAIMTGSLECHTYTPLDVILDPMLRSPRTDWLITRRLVNKFDLIARFANSPDAQVLADKIFRCGREQLEVTLDIQMIGDRGGYQTERVWLYQFWHEKTPACPRGLQVTFLNGDVVLAYDALKYRRVPVQRLAPAGVKDSPWGMTEAWTILAPQEAIDTIGNIMVTNMKSFGAGSVLSPKGSGVQATDIAQGLKLLEYNPINGLKPEPLRLPETSPTLPAHRKEIITEMGTIMGVTGVNRGEAQASLESGSALALMAAQGSEAAAPFGMSIARFNEGVAFNVVAVMNDFLKGDLRIAIMGEGAAQMKTITGKDVDSIIRVNVKQVPPLMKSAAGRFDFAKFLAERFPEKVSPSQMFKVMEDGEWEEITDAPAAEEANIGRENELLAEGIGPPPPKMGPMGQPLLGPDGRPVPGDGIPGRQYVRAIVTDDPVKHIIRHRAVLDSPAAREDPNVTKAVLAHIDDHLNKYADATVQQPGLLQVLGLPPLQAALPPPLMQAGPGASGPAGPPGPQSGPANSSPPSRPPASRKPPSDAGPSGPNQPPKQPMFPTNPQDGRRYTPPEPS